MTTHARVVVIGGGNMDAGVLYHLAHMGWHDCILLEKNELTSGATWHAAGPVSRMVGGQALGSIHDYAVDLYTRIEDETEVGVSWHGCGSLRVATSPDHMDWINHVRDAVLARGKEAEIIGPDEVARLNPLYDVKAAGVIRSSARLRLPFSKRTRVPPEPGWRSRSLAIGSKLRFFLARRGTERMRG